MSESDDARREADHFSGASGPSRSRARAPLVGPAEMAALRLIGPFEIECDGQWTHYVFSPVTSEADRQRSFLEGWTACEQAKRRAPADDIFDAVEWYTKAAEISRTRFLAALPNDPGLLDTRVPIHFNGNGGIFILLDSKVWNLTEQGQWVERPQWTPAPKKPEPTDLERAVGAIESRLTELDGGLYRLAVALEALKPQPKRPWWRFWRRS